MLSKAINFAIKNESKMDRDIGAALENGHFEEPWPIGKTIGPVKKERRALGSSFERANSLKLGAMLNFVDMTFSISKSYLSLCMGIAVNDGIIPNIHDPIRNIVKDGGLKLNKIKITWAHMLQLTSEWEGTLWEKPDWIDHYRDVIGNSVTQINGEVNVNCSRPAHTGSIMTYA